MRADSFLQAGPAPRPWAQSDSASGLKPVEYFLGGGRNGLEVAVAHAAKRPTLTAVRTLWRARHGGKASPLLLVVLWEDGGEARAWLCGPVGDEPRVYEDLNASHAERIAHSALSESDRHGAIRLLKATLPETESDLPGLRNAGMFATYHLRERVPQRPDWETMGARGKNMLSRSGRDLVEALGFEIEPRGATTSVLRIRENGRATAVAVFLDDNESAETLSGRFRDSSPVTTALARATAENLRYVILTRGREIRLYGTEPDVGVGRKGRSETYVEANLTLLPDERAAYLPLIFGAEALRPRGTFEQILEHSRDFAAGIGERLRDRVYDHVVPALALALGRAQLAHAPDDPLDAHLDEIYEAAMTVLFRLLFVAYAEDKGLLPYEKNEVYRQHSLKMLARLMAEAANREELRYDQGATTYWHRAEELWHAVDKGSRAWGLPPYNGGLFSEDRSVSSVGARIADVELPDELFGPALFELLVEKTDQGVHGPVDFAALSVREFGTIYEGLLESSLAVAKEDLKRDRNDRYVPAVDDEDAVVKEGEVFLQGNDGARKATGSYFTPHFAVEHLLDRSLVPALERHLGRVQDLVNAGKEGPAAREFFNFRVADISMGSGHFLVAAVDRIEAGLSDFLERHPLRGVVEELERLRAIALENLGPWGEGETIERASLLRRQIARRCIYGVDVNHVAVQLAQVSLWIHTFVEGLPLSFLNRSLVYGDSLFGAANAAGAEELLAPPEAGLQSDLFTDLARREVESVRADLEKAARSSDATEAEIRGAREAYEKVRERLAPLREALDIAVASTVDPDLKERWSDNVDRLLRNESFRHGLLRKADSKLLEPRSIHFPLEFPEVFYPAARLGFDCIVGNPPWEKRRPEEHEFWARHDPGLRGMGRGERDERMETLRQTREELVTRLEAERDLAGRERDFLRRIPGMNTGHPDLFRAFTWRFGHVVGEGSYIGVVLPGDAFKITGGEPLRRLLHEEFDRIDVQFLTNRGGWVFPDVHPQKLIALVAARRGINNATYLLPPECHDRSEWEERAESDYEEFAARQIEAFSPSLILPILPAATSGALLHRLLEGSERLGSHPDIEVVRVYADFETSRDRHRWLQEPGPNRWPVYKGESFDLWTPDTGVYYAFTKSDEILKAAVERRGRVNRNSPYFEMPEEWREDPTTHPILRARIALRHVTNRTNQRTLITSLIPPRVVATETAPWVLWLPQEERERKEAFLLGCMSSRIVDWWARRYVEGHFYKDAFEAVRVPEWQPASPLVERTIEIAARLAAADERFAEWAAPLGVAVGSVETAETPSMLAELDAVIAHQFGLAEDHVNELMETFHKGWDHKPHVQRTLGHYRVWARKLGLAPATS